MQGNMSFIVSSHSQDAYVWLYDPTPWYYWIGGTFIVLGIIAICLFPLWPPIMRKVCLCPV